jgi:hypothetical protein
MVDVDNYVKTGSKFLTHNKPEFLSDLWNEQENSVS